MNKEKKENTVAVKNETSFKECLWVVIPVVLLVGLIATLVYNHHAEFSWNGFVA
ncbi:MAG: sulfite exporter TauE/SafE family protein, partial [Methylotenera sp.]|nr:sulfite exporter TauE/SafE family protein [Flavobacterium sp.]